MPAPREFGHRLRARRDVQRLQDRADVDLDGALGQAEVAADELVGLALREQPQHVGLARRQSQRGRADARAVGAGGSGVVGGSTDNRLEHLPQRFEQRRGRSRSWR